MLLKLRSNWLPGVTVALVSIPLSISLALAAGASPQMGIITAVWAGIIAAIFGGSNFNVVGPTGALSGILASYALLHGVGSLPLLAIASGVFVLIVYALKLEKYIVLIPASVLHGFTLGVAFIIGLGQLNSALGLTPGKVHETFIANFFETLKVLSDFNVTAAFIATVGVILLLSLSKRIPKFPAVIAVSSIGILLGLLTTKNILSLEIATIQSKYGDIPNSIFAFPTDLSLSLLNATLITTAVTIAIVAILETLISGKIADGMTRTRFDQRKEMFGLGLANIGSGVMGGIPATAALARTSLNVKSGGNHKTSAFVSSVSIALISIVLIPFFQYLPLSIVASILIYVAINMVKAEHFQKLYKFDRKTFYLALFVASLTVVWEPIAAIAVGTTIALVLFVNELAVANGEVNINDAEHKLIGRSHTASLSQIDKKGRTIVYRFAGELMYINAQAHRAAIEQIKGNTDLVIFSLRNLYYMDLDGAEMLAEIIDDLKNRNKRVAISGVNSLTAVILEKTEWYQQLKDQGCVYDDTTTALKELQKRV